MKALKKLILFAAIPTLAVALQSCDNDRDYYNPYENFPTAIVTVKPIDANSYYFQLDDDTKLWPLDNTKLPYGEKEMRAFVKYEDAQLPDGVDGGIYAKAVKVSWLDSIRTKNTVVSTTVAEDEQKYGQDPVTIWKDWTVVEDGYMTIHFSTWWGNSNIKHEVNLVTGANPEDPYEVHFRHNDFNDYPARWSDGVVAFRLADLPDTNGETVKLTLKFMSVDQYSGAVSEKSVEFDYRTREE